MREKGVGAGSAGAGAPAPQVLALEPYLGSAARLATPVGKWRSEFLTPFLGFGAGMPYIGTFRRFSACAIAISGIDGARSATANSCTRGEAMSGALGGTLDGSHRRGTRGDILLLFGYHTAHRIQLWRSRRVRPNEATP